jgi:hypothetical protein
MSVREGAVEVGRAYRGAGKQPWSPRPLAKPEVVLNVNKGFILVAGSYDFRIGCREFGVTAR